MFISQQETRYQSDKHAPAFPLNRGAGSSHLPQNHNCVVHLSSDSQLYDFVLESILRGKKTQQCGLAQITARLIKDKQNSPSWIQDIYLHSSYELAMLLHDEETLFSKPALEIICYVLRIRLTITFQDSIDKRSESFGNPDDKLVSAIGTDDGYLVQSPEKAQPKSNQHNVNKLDFSRAPDGKSKQSKFARLPRTSNDEVAEDPHSLNKTLAEQRSMYGSELNTNSTWSSKNFELRQFDTNANAKKRTVNKNNQYKLTTQKNSTNDSESKKNYDNALRNKNTKENIYISTLSDNSTHLDTSKVSRSEKTAIVAPLFPAKAKNPDTITDRTTDPNFKKALDFICSYQMQFQQKPVTNTDSKKYKPVVIGKTDEYVSGKLKFYKDKEKFGFVLLEDSTEIFLHKDNIVRSNIDSTAFQNCSQFFDILLRFKVLYYQSSKNCKTKAVDIEIVNFLPKAQLN